MGESLAEHASLLSVNQMRGLYKGIVSGPNLLS